jgi:hypothetical protein
MSDGGDDSIPVMEDIPTHSEAGEAGEEEGVSNIANVNFKLAIKSEMKLSDSHIEAIKTVTAKGNVRNRASIFLQKVDAQKSPRNMNSPMQSGNDHIDSIKKNTEAGNVRNRANMFLKKVDAHQSSPSVPSSSSGKHNSPSNQRRYSAGGSEITSPTTTTNEENEEFGEMMTAPSTPPPAPPVTAASISTESQEVDEDEEEEEDDDEGESDEGFGEEDQESLEAVRKSIHEAQLIEAAAQAQTEIALEAAAAIDAQAKEATSPPPPPIPAPPVPTSPSTTTQDVDPDTKKLVPGKSSLYECPFSYPFDKHGAIHWIGTDGDTKTYENPQETGQIYVVISTLYRGKLDNLTSYNEPKSSADRIAAATYTNNSSKSWIIVDFGPTRSLRPSFYCLKHGASGIGNAIRHWVLEAKVDENSPWVELRRHTNDSTMREEPQSKAGYELTSEVCKKTFYRIFRITQTGKNSGGNDCLFIGGLDFYGIIKITPLVEEGSDEAA